MVIGWFNLVQIDLILWLLDSIWSKHAGYYLV